jgi:hypothetical protein
MRKSIDTPFWPALRYDALEVAFLTRQPRDRVHLAGRSYALLSLQSSCSTAIVFVHGFRGCSEKTWLQFQTLPDRLRDTWWHECDFFFYSYDSTGTQIWPNISSLNGFLRDVFPEPRWRKLGSPTVGPARKYRNVVLRGALRGGGAGSWGDNRACQIMRPR